MFQALTGNYTVGQVIYLFNNVATMAMTFVSFMLTRCRLAFDFISRISTFADRPLSLLQWVRHHHVNKGRHFSTSWAQPPSWKLFQCLLPACVCVCERELWSVLWVGTWTCGRTTVEKRAYKNPPTFNVMSDSNLHGCWFADTLVMKRTYRKINYI